MTTIIKQKIDSIAECISDKIQNDRVEDDFGLYSGDFGILLFLIYYSNYSTTSDKYISLIEKFTEDVFNRFPKNIGIHTFCDGLSGILYSLEFLQEKKYVDIDISDAQSTFDEYLCFCMRQNIQQNNYDFLHGALGVGFYFLKKGNNSYIQELIDFLYNTAEIDKQNKICKWKSIIDFEKKTIGYNISLSHGISSIIIFLSRVIKSGKINDKVLELLHGAVNYVLSQQIDFLRIGSHFPIFSLDNKTQPIIGSRLAWCYGDLGVGMALWQAGKAAGELTWTEKGLGVLINATQRLSMTENNVFDAGICHGSAGIALVYHRMYLETHINEFKEATDYWLNQTINIAKFEDGLAGYKSYIFDGWNCNYSLLSGISGIGLTLISCIDNSKQKWDEMLLLS